MITTHSALVVLASLLVTGCASSAAGGREPGPNPEGAPALEGATRMPQSEVPLAAFDADDPSPLNPVDGLPCAVVLATHDVHNPSIRWTAAPPKVRADQVVLAIELSPYCAIAPTGALVVLGAARDGADTNVKVSSSLRVFLQHGGYAAVIPAPGPGGKVRIEWTDDVRADGGQVQLMRGTVGVDGT